MDPDPGKEIEVDPYPDLDPERRLKWIRIRIRNAVQLSKALEMLINDIIAKIRIISTFFMIDIFRI